VECKGHDFILLLMVISVSCFVIISRLECLKMEIQIKSIKVYKVQAIMLDLMQQVDDNYLYRKTHR